MLFVLMMISVFTAVHGEVAAAFNLADNVQLDSGPIRGKVEDGVNVFLGIPYAAPPVGKLRWKPPQKVTAWKKVKNSTDFGPSCPQPEQHIFGNTGNFSEDCLYLNVWSPTKKPDERLPVMVWIHGGGFNAGSASQPEYDGSNLAGKGVIVVTVNYRLGPLGFLVHPSLTEESSHDTSGNYGLLDQIAALQWVQKNIAAFGGNPDLVTIFGQSAGSRSVALLMISPLSAGLFQRAIAQSGGPIIGSEYLSVGYNGDMANASKMGEKLAAKLGCDKAKNVLTALRAKPAREIVAAAGHKINLFDDEALTFAPVFDGWVLPENPLTAYESGRQHDVPLIVGSTANEGTLYLTDEKDLTVEKYKSFLKSRFAGQTAEALAMFPAGQDKDVARAIDSVITVAANAYPARLMAQCVERRISRSYLYQFTRRPDTVTARKLGAYHGVDLAYVFGNMDEADGYDDTDRDLSEKMMTYWVNFARTGNPNGRGLFYWPGYKSKSDLNLEFSDTIHSNQNLFQKECDFISRVPHYRPGKIIKR